MAKKLGKWLSNVSEEDAVKVRRTFSQVVQSTPRATEGWSTADLIKDGIVGLYEEKVKNNG